MLWMEGRERDPVEHAGGSESFLPRQFISLPRYASTSCSFTSEELPTDAASTLRCPPGEVEHRDEQETADHPVIKTMFKGLARVVCVQSSILVKRGVGLAAGVRTVRQP